MVSKLHGRVVRRRRRRTRKWRWALSRTIRLVRRAGRRTKKAFLACPRWFQIVAAIGAIAIGWLTLNWMYQAIRKPTELFFPVSGRLVKFPAETWSEYESLFRKHSTAVMTPELLAALAQIEGSGDPLARTYWEWRPATNPFEVYRPASSAVGMYQITDGTFQEAKRLCIHDHEVVKDGPWHDFNSCWFNSLYMRILPSHAIELTAAWLDRGVSTIITRHKLTRASLQQKQNLATVIHLCGAGTGNDYARRRFRLTRNQRCGSHDVKRYLTRVNAMKKQFARLASSQ